MTAHRKEATRKRTPAATSLKVKTPKATTAKGKTSVSAKPTATSPEVKALLKKAPALKSFEKVNFSPMLASIAERPFDAAGWSYEIKWDGYRAVMFKDRSPMELKSRNDKSFEEKFYPVYQALEQWDIDVVIDGEIVAIREDGLPDFSTLQNWRSEADGDLLFYAFDIVWLQGKDLRDMPLSQRRAILESVVPKDHSVIRLSHSFIVNGTEFFTSAKKMGLEGIMAKRLDSPYLSGDRTTNWIKIKANKRQEVVIGGFTKNENSSKAFSSLLVGIFEEGKFVYTGKIGTGFTASQQQDMMSKFNSLITNRSPFEVEPDYNKPSRFNPKPAKAMATWLEPQLVCEVSFTEMTSDGVMRHPSFEGMREDKDAKDVGRDRPIADPVKAPVKRKTEKDAIATVIKPSGKRQRKTLLNPTDETQVRDINTHTIRFTNLSKLYWPEDQVSKRDMLNYYYQVAPFLLPYLKNRPQSLNRFPNGIHGKSFYQKDVTGKVPDWVDTYQYHSSDEEDVDKHFLVPQDESDILLMASMGCIEMNPWSSRVDKPDHPDWCIIDLDPAKTTTFNQVIEAAQITHQLLKQAGIANYCKTSGSTGLHIYIPLGAKYTYEQSKEFARVIVTQVHREIPAYTSIERIITNRRGKMYLDFLQNRPKATLAAPYSLRPKPGATVSMPLHWEEVKQGLKMTDFTIGNAMARINETGDLFKPVLGSGISLETLGKMSKAKRL